MAVFEDIKIGWDGKTYTIPSDKVLPAIARIEEVMTLDELYRYGQRQTAPMAKMSMAYGTVLRFAGADVTDDEVYAGIIGPGDKQSAALAAINTLMQMMIPPEALRAMTEEAGKAAKGKPKPPKAS